MTALAKLHAKLQGDAQRLGVAFAGGPPARDEVSRSVDSGGSQAVALPGTETASVLANITTVPADTLRVPLTLFRGTYATEYGSDKPATPVRVEPALTVPQLFDLLAPGSAPALVPGGMAGKTGTPIERAKRGHANYALSVALTSGEVRSDATARTGHWLAIDMDGVSGAEASRVFAQLRAAGCAFLAYTTFSDGLKDIDKGRRIRVVLPLDRPADKAAYGICYRAVCKLLGIEADEAAAKPSQLAGCWCAPSPEVIAASELNRPAWAPFKEQAVGAALGVDKLLEVARQIGSEAPGNPAGPRSVVAMNDDLSSGLYAPATLERVREALDMLDANVAYPAWIKVGQCLKAVGQRLGDDAMAALWLGWCTSARDDRKAKNADEYAPAAKWATFTPSMPADVAENALCELAKRSALMLGQSARGAPSWHPHALAGVRYLQKFHASSAGEFATADYPALPADQTAPHQVALVELASQVVRVHLDQNGIPVALGPLGPRGRVEAVPLTDHRLGDELLLRSTESGKRPPSREQMDAMRSVLSARARRDGAIVRVHQRVGRHENGSVVLDLGDNEGRAIVMGREGVRIETDHGMLFRRGHGYGQLPVPSPEQLDCTADGLQAAWSRLVDWLTSMGMRRREAVLSAVALVRWLLPTGTFPLIELVGAAGSGKSTRLKQLCALLDPQTDGEAVSPRSLEDREVMAACTSTAVIGVDNISKWSATEQDMVCRLATGAKFSTRELFTTAESRHVFAHVRVVIGCITPVITRSDLRDRALQVSLSAPRNGLKTADEAAAEFQQAHAGLVGALCVLFQAAQKHWAEVGPAEHRLVEFVTTGKAIYLALGLNPLDFSADFAAHRAERAAQASEGDPVMRSLLPALSNLAASAQVAETLPPWGQWAEKPGKGHAAIEHPAGGRIVVVTPSALVGLLKAHAPSDVLLNPREQAFLPAHPRAVDGALTRLVPTLRALGYEVEKKEFAAKRIAWVFTRGN